MLGSAQENWRAIKVDSAPGAPSKKIRCPIGRKPDFGPTRVGTISIGILNTHHFAPGDVIELIPATEPTRGVGADIAARPQAAVAALGKTDRIATLKYDASDFLPDDAPSSTSQVVHTDFDISVDPAFSSFTAQIKAALRKNTRLTLIGGSRHALARSLAVLSAPENQTVRDQILQHRDRQYIIVSGTVNGTKVELQYQDDNSATGKLDLLKIPGSNYELNVVYNCSNITSIEATGTTPAPLAFYYMTVGAVGERVDTIPTADLGRFGFPNAFMETVH